MSALWVRRFAGRLCAAVALAAVVCGASSAFAERPPEQVHVRHNDSRTAVADGQPELIRSDAHLELDRTVGPTTRRENMTPPPPLADLTRESSSSTNPRQPFELQPAVVEERQQSALGWGLTRTGASVFTGALLFHLGSRAQQGEREALSPSVNGARYEEVEATKNQQRKLVMGLYALGGSMITGGIVLLATDDEDDEDGVKAKLSPHWMKGRPAARIKISF